MRAVELFVGAGGLAMGTSNAGFRHEVLVEWNKDACDTILANKARGVHPVADWPLVQADVTQFDFSSVAVGVDLLAGGPPCQPFSLGGKHRGHRDHRNLFPEMMRAVRELQPRAVLIENVKGLLRESFARYFEYIVLQLAHPELKPKDDERWESHWARLERHHTSGSKEGLSYRVVFQLLNSADYGVPQRRERLLIVGIRADQGVEFSFPEATHSREQLVHDQWVTGDYWDRHRVAKRKRPGPPRPVSERCARAAGRQTKPWATVRDAISDLPDPERRPNKARAVTNHLFNPGARSYAGHTGSPLDEPAKTLKAGVHGVPGGENMLALPDGSVRYFTVREAARLQTFPDRYTFQGCWSEAMRQLGNAVPVHLGSAVATRIATLLQPQPKAA